MARYLYRFAVYLTTELEQYMPWHLSNSLRSQRNSRADAISTKAEIKRIYREAYRAQREALPMPTREREMGVFIETVKNLGRTFFAIFVTAAFGFAYFFTAEALL